MPKVRFIIIWTQPAIEDFENVLEFIAQRNPERAVQLKQQFQAHIDTLAHHPERGRFVPETMAIGVELYRELILPPYRAVFRIRAKKVFIMGFFDGRRDLEDTLFERLSR
jgi:toxin ParE1/3/4